MIKPNKNYVQPHNIHGRTKKNIYLLFYIGYIGVWFQNSRAKDKKSRNQRQYAHISDDNNSFDGSSGKEVGNNSNNSNNGFTGGADIKSTKTLALSQESNDQLQDCQLCQIPQVNMHKHAFTVEHICKMKNLLEQTSEFYAHSNASGSDNDNECDRDRERRFYSLSKAFLLQHVVSNASNNIAPTASTGQVDDENNCLINYDPRESVLTADDSPADGRPATAAAVGHLAGDIAVSVKDNDNDMPEAGRKTSSANRDLMQKLFNRNHITVYTQH
ncbi:hypothetical protein AWZ03_013465 [Drosophila navojoa]|uniref:Uncharacterized protein n=1 Tax=Drosophila navojoa TaxID=7232 RepID=A0A484AUN4_DRONA|nr:hypothetical protein AWZ03_013465 [Drosophila navojoa]